MGLSPQVFSIGRGHSLAPKTKPPPRAEASVVIGIFPVVGPWIGYRVGFNLFPIEISRVLVFLVNDNVREMIEMKEVSLHIALQSE